MKVYLLQEHDFEKLLLMIDRDPAHGTKGGSSTALSEQENRAHQSAHRFYNFQIRAWLEEVKK